MKFINFFVGLLEPIISLFNKHGVAKTLGYMFIIMLLIQFGYNTYTLFTLDNKINRGVTEVINTQAEEAAKQHVDGMTKRMENLEQVSYLLKECIYLSGADRACILEMHNGTNNTAGLPFIYAEMTYEEVKIGIEDVSDNYAKLNLSKYSFPTYLMENTFFKGNMDEVAMIDNKISAKMSAEGTTYVFVYAMYGTNHPIGYFVLTWSGETNPILSSSNANYYNMIANIQKLSILLNTD